jgi:hypothetical protein
MRSRGGVCVWTNSTRGRRRASNCAGGRPVAIVSARTRASSSAIPAPSAMLGDIAWAASPTSTTRPRTHRRVDDLLDRREVRRGSDRQVLADERGERLGERAEQLGERAEQLGQPGRIAAAGVGPHRDVDVAVTVDPAAAQRDGEEGHAAPKPYRPRRDLCNAVDEEAPACLPQEPGRRAGEDGGAHPGAHAVGPHHQVVVAGRAVVEDRADPAARAPAAR